MHTIAKKKDMLLLWLSPTNRPKDRDTAREKKKEEN
jgi:hypothetical protein